MLLLTKLCSFLYDLQTYSKSASSGQMKKIQGQQPNTINNWVYWVDPTGDVPLSKIISV
jgi:hypothetical protein